MRSRIAIILPQVKALLVTLVAVILAAVGGTTVGYAALNKSVTLSLDGQAQTVTAMGGTVGDVLAAEGIEVTDKDLVAPAVDEPIEDGTRISVQFGRTLALNVDGEERTYWVNSTTVASALGEIGRRFEGADLSTSRSAPLGRTGMTLDVVTPKVLKVKVGDKRAQAQEAHRPHRRGRPRPRWTSRSASATRSPRPSTRRSPTATRSSSPTSGS